MRVVLDHIEISLAQSVTVTEDTLHVDLSDGRTISVPLAWYPRLLHATPDERQAWRFIAKGRGFHWESVDEDISIEGLLAGRASGESQTLFKRWLSSRPSSLPTRSTPTRSKRRAR